YVNQHKRFVDEPIRVPPSQHTDQMRLILEALAYTHSYETMPITRLVQRESRNLPWGSTVVVISAMPESAILSALVEMKRTGRSVVLIVIGGPESSINKESLTVYHIPEEVAWRELEMISMTG
ncbi:MAG: hypothetical protein QF713_04475, partial [Dehalococcoidales bacterium]|nr:hypothetical protein [Dehalococcoidales bacterium]